MNRAIRKRRARTMLAAATAAALIVGVCACRRAGDGGKPTTMNPASSEVMGNTAGVTGTPGESGAATRADGAAASPPPAASAAPVTSAPAGGGQ